MARLSKICLAALAFMVVATYAAPCHDGSDDIGEVDYGCEDCDLYGDGNDHNGSHNDGEDYTDGDSNGSHNDHHDYDGEDYGDDEGDCDDDGEYYGGDHNGSHNDGEGYTDGDVNGSHNDNHGGYSGDGDHNGSHNDYSGEDYTDEEDCSDALVQTNIGHIGTGDVNTQKSLNNAADVSDLSLHDVVQDVDAL